MTNPYAPPNSAALPTNLPQVRLHAVGRIYVWIGLLGAVIYVPIVAACVVNLVALIIGFPLTKSKITPFELAIATLLNSMILSIWITFILTARQVAARNIHARSTALVLAVLLMLAFPIFTIPGYFCFRWIKMYLKPIVLLPHVPSEE